MYKFVLKRIVMLIPVIIGVTFVVFFILSVAPGDPVLTILGDGATDEAIAQMREELGLNDPILVRYVNYIWDVLHGDFGLSYKTRLPVSDQLIARFPNTMLLASCGIVLAIAFGIPLGILSAKKQYTLLDNVATVGCPGLGVHAQVLAGAFAGNDLFPEHRVVPLPGHGRRLSGYSP